MVVIHKNFDKFSNPKDLFKNPKIADKINNPKNILFSDDSSQDKNFLNRIKNSYNKLFDDDLKSSKNKDFSSLKKDIFGKNYKNDLSLYSPKDKFAKDLFNNDIFKNKPNKNYSSLINSQFINQLKSLNAGKFNQSNALSGLTSRTSQSVEELIQTIPDEVSGITDISELSMRSKRVLLRVVSKLNTKLFNSRYEHLPILPKNKEEYCTLMQKLAKAVSLDVLPVSEQAVENYYSAMHNLENVLPQIDISALDIKLQMPRNIFEQRAKMSIEKLEEADKRKVFDYFGFEIKDGKVTGYPANNPEKLFDGKINHKTQKAVEELSTLIDNFTQENRIILPTEQKPLEEALNDVVKVFPEFLTSIGKKQHGTHELTLDLHLLKVLQESMRHPDYKKLSTEDKKVLNIATLLHDIAKIEGEVDKTHQYESALDISCIIQKLDLPIEQQERIVNIVKNHHWLEILDKSSVCDEETLKSIAFSFRKPNDLLMAKIFAESDLKGVSDSFYKSHKQVLNSDKLQKVEKYLSDIYKTGIYLPQTLIPNASELRIEPVKLGLDEKMTENTVIELSKHSDLKTLGFADSQLQTFVHVFDGEDAGIATLNELAKEANDAVLSTSYIDRNNFGTYWDKKIGVLLEADSTNIINLSDKNIGSGTKKDLKSQVFEIFEGKNDLFTTNNSRRDISDRLKLELGLGDGNYAKLYQELASASDFDSINDKKLKKAIQDVAQHYMKKEGSHNEATILAPKITGIFVKFTKADDIPYEIRKFAQDNDLPIILFGN